MFVLFDKNKKVINHIPKNRTITAICTEEENGLIKLEAEFYKSEYDKINEAEYIGHKDPTRSGNYYIYKTVSAQLNNTVVLRGVHLFFDDLKTADYIDDARPKNKTVAEGIKHILHNTDWHNELQIHSQARGTANWYRKNRLEAWGEFLDKWNVTARIEMFIERNEIASQRLIIEDISRFATQKPTKRIVYEHNTSDTELIYDKTDLFTAAIGIGKGEEKTDENGEGTGNYGRKIKFTDVEWLISDGYEIDKYRGKDYVEIKEATEKYGHSDGTPRMTQLEFSDCEDPEELLALTYEKLKELSKPKVTIKTSVEYLGNSCLGDTVQVIRKDIEAYYTARIIKIERNLLNDALTAVEIGDYNKNFTGNQEVTLRNRIESINGTVEELRHKDRANDRMINELRLGLIRSMYSDDAFTYKLEKGNKYRLPAGVISLDAPIDGNPEKAIYFGAGKMAIANKKDSSGEFLWETIGNGDGLVADNIVTGTLTGGNVKWNLDTGEFLIGKNDRDYQLKFDGDTLKFNMDDPKFLTEVGDKLRPVKNLIDNGRFSFGKARWSGSFDLSGSNGGSDSFRTATLTSWTTLKQTVAYPVYKDQTYDLIIKYKGWIEPKISIYRDGALESTQDLVRDASFDEFGVIRRRIMIEKDVELNGLMIEIKNLGYSKHEEEHIPLEIESVCLVNANAPLGEDKEWVPSENDGVGVIMEEIPPTMLPDWFQEWDATSTWIGGKHIVTPCIGVGYGTKEGVLMGDSIYSDGKYTYSGIVGVKDEEVIWLLNSEGGAFFGKDPNRRLTISPNGDLKLPLIRSGDIDNDAVGYTEIQDGAITTRHLMADCITSDQIKAGSISSRELTANCITTRELAAGAITTGMLLPGGDNRIVFEEGSDRNNLLSIDGTDGVMRLKYSAGNYVRVDKNGVHLYCNGNMTMSTGGKWRGVTVDTGTVMEKGNSDTLMAIRSDTGFHCKQGGTQILAANRDGVYAADGYYLTSDSTKKENLKPFREVKTETVVRPNPEKETPDIIKSDAIDFVKNARFFTYNLKNGNPPFLSIITQDVKGEIRDYLVQKKDKGNASTQFINLYSYVSTLHVSIQDLYKENEEIREENKQLKEEIANLWKAVNKLQNTQEVTHENN